MIDPADEGRAFDQRPIPSRIAVLLAGPAFNFLFAIAAYWILFSGGISVLQPAVGAVQPGSHADRAGLQMKDKIITVGDEQAIDWDVTLAAILTEMVDTGRVPMTVQGTDGRTRNVTIEVGADSKRLTEPRQLWDGLGFAVGGPPVVISQLADDGVAIQSGLQLGDEISHIANEPVDAFSLEAAIKARAGEPVNIGFIRDGAARSVRLEIAAREVDGATTGYLGVGWGMASDDYYRLRDYSAIESLRAATAKTWDQSVFTIKMLSRIVTGDVSIKNISGPINIAQIAGDSTERGMRYFITILAVISLSLGILNLLPIPVLDGGQIVYQLVEAVKGSPLTERAQILGQQVGVFALLLLMSFAFYNDIARILVDGTGMTIRNTFLALLLVLPATALPADDFVVRDMRVEGLQRISEGTVFNYLPVNIGDTLDGVRIAEAIRSLYGQNLFDDIEMRRDGDTLVVVVQERPSIESFEIDGNKDIKTEDLMESLRGVGLARGRTFDRSVLDNVEMFLREQYYDRGKYGVEIDTNIQERPNNTVRIKIDVKEGDRAKIRR